VIQRLDLRPRGRKDRVHVSATRCLLLASGHSIRRGAQSKYIGTRALNINLKRKDLTCTVDRLLTRRRKEPTSAG
jgi:hypothetical protein